MSTATSRWRTCIGRELSHIQRYPVRGAPDGSAARNSRECAAPSGGDREAAAGHCESIPHERTRQRSLTLRNVRAPEHRSDAHPLGTRELLWRPTPRTLALGGQAGATPAISRSIETRRGCCVKGAGGRVGVDGAGCARRSPVGSGAGFSVFQMAVAASLCLWSFSRLWVAVIRRHSERAADLPRRWKRSIRRLNLVLANTGSIIALRFA